MKINTSVGRTLILVVGICAMLFAVVAIVVDGPGSKWDSLAAGWLLILGAFIYAFGRYGCLPERYYREAV